MAQNKNMGPGDGLTMRNSFNAIMFFAQCHCMAVIPFFRTGMGREAMGFHALLAFVALVLLSLNDPVGGWYLVLWLAAVVWRRVETYWNHARGYIVHSQYWGDSWFLLLVKNNKLAALIEGSLCYISGAVLATASRPVGLFLMWGAASYALVMLFDLYYMRRRIQEMHDAQIETQWTQELYRRGE